MCFTKLAFRSVLFSLIIALGMLCGGCGMPSFLVTPALGSSFAVNAILEIPLKNPPFSVGRY